MIITVLHKSDGTWYAILYAANTTFAIPLTLEGQASLHMIFILSWGTYLPAFLPENGSELLSPDIL